MDLNSNSFTEFFKSLLKTFYLAPKHPRYLENFFCKKNQTASESLTKFFPFFYIKCLWFIAPAQLAGNQIKH